MSLLGMVSVASCGGAAVVGGRWALHQKDALGRPIGFPVWSVSLLVLLALATAVPSARRKMEERRLGRVASQLVGHAVTVKCQTTAGSLVDVHGELGFVRYGADGVPERRTEIKRDPCKQLQRYLSGHRALGQDAVIAVHVLTHEAMHMRGETNEARAECQAVQRDRTTSELLGATPEQALALARTYWLTVYPDMPDDYRSQDCGPGGAWDEHLTTAAWG
jgi:hypothetical protein